MQSLRKVASGAARSAVAQLPSILGVGYSPYEEGGQAARVPSVAEEARKHSVFFGEKRLEGESADLRKFRLSRRKDYVECYGPALIESEPYQSADDDLKTKMLKKFADRTNELANERDPDLGKLDADAIATGIRKSEKTTDKRRERSRERLFYAPQ